MIKRVLVAGVFAVIALFVVAPASSAAPPAGFTCTPDGVVCHFSFPDQRYGPVNIGIACGSGASSFDIFDQGVESDRGTVWLDASGSATKIVDLFVVTDAMWSNPLTGDVVPYTQHVSVTTVFAVAGDEGTATQTVTGENLLGAGSATKKWVLQANGRAVTDPYGNVVSTTPNQAFFTGDPDAFDQVCATLGA
jgi:hypothetical protein